VRFSLAQRAAGHRGGRSVVDGLPDIRLPRKAFQPRRNNSLPVTGNWTLLVSAGGIIVAFGQFQTQQIPAAGVGRREYDRRNLREKTVDIDILDATASRSVEWMLKVITIALAAPTRGRPCTAVRISPTVDTEIARDRSRLGSLLIVGYAYDMSSPR
jgi:hypothetical protein